MPIDKDFQGSIKLTTGYEVKFNADDMHQTMNHLSLAIVGELSNKHLFQTENPSSETFQKGVFEEINNIMNTQLPDEESASQLMANMLFWHLTDRFFVDMAASLHLPDGIKQRFLKRDWSLISDTSGMDKSEKEAKPKDGGNGE